MRYSIHQISADTWELRDERGQVVGTFADVLGRTGYALALAALGGIITSELRAATGTPAGLLPEVWTSEQGIAFSERLPGGRDFSQCSWSWRDPTSTLVPLMLQTETDFGHMGAELAGFVEEFAQSAGTVTVPSGRFYDQEIGVQARDLLLDGRRFGVSVDPTENVVAEFTCVAPDTLILMGDGSYRQISRIHVGERVQTLEGPRKVLRSQSVGIGEAVEACCGESKVVMSLRHRVLSASGDWTTPEDFAVSSRGHRNVGTAIVDGLPGWRQPERWYAPLTLLGPGLSSTGYEPCCAHEYVPIDSVPRGLPDRCRRAGHSGGGRVHFDRGDVRGRIPSPGDAGERTLTATLLDDQPRIPAHTLAPLMYPHPYTMADRQQTEVVHRASVEMVPVGEEALWDMTVEGANHYVSFGGIVHSNCTEYDEEGWCVDGDTVFSAYEIGGLTMCPFPGFENAAIVLAAEPADGSTATILAASAVPARPPITWFQVPEPLAGHEWLPGIQGEEVLVDQGDGTFACPLTINDDGSIYGHVYRLGQCHTAQPWGPGVCATAEPSANGYATFHTGSVACEDGTLIPTGSIVVGAEHSYAASTWAAVDHYANAGSGWADVRVVDGEHGAWACGALRPGLSDEQLRVLRALSLSGEWRDVGGHLELIGILSVNQPGFPIARQQLAASGFAGIPDADLRITSHGGRIVRMSGAGIVSACPECQKRRQVAANGHAGTGDRALLQSLDGIRATLTLVEQRTRHLIGPAAELARERLHR